eukprot:TRINITY_DN19563_c0_g1_i1.p1 TRINITY_DN19563_c0_g1~~TRINITY_DN19563_c0_g1_i1.p1  ORF type:complete len:202 (-),score=13.14 TRINITY_DN19563_c0_g1_i1:469-1074(-)
MGTVTNPRPNPSPRRWAQLLTLALTLALTDGRSYGSCCCCTHWEACVMDRVFVYYFDKSPHRSAACHCCGFPTCVPCTCCGPPVIYAESPTCCCCIDTTMCCGERLSSSQHNCCGWKLCVCCADPCYTCPLCICCGGTMPLLWGLKNSQNFMSVYKMAYNNYKAKHRIGSDEAATFRFDGSRVQTAQQATLVMNKVQAWNS